MLTMVKEKDLKLVYDVASPLPVLFQTKADFDSQDIVSNILFIMLILHLICL